MCDAIGCAASGESSVDRPGASSSAGTTTDDRPTTVRPSGRFFPLWRPQSAMLHCRRPALARQAPLVARAAAGSSSLPSADKLRSAILREPWDSSPRPWRLFWAVKLSAAVLESDAAAQSLRLLPVESVGLSPPASLDDARRRAATNLVVFRQNYLAAGLLAAAACATRHAALLCGCALLLLAAVCSSDRLLGEVSLATDGQLIWNANRVGGLDRTLSVRAAWAAAGGAFCRRHAACAAPSPPSPRSLFCARAPPQCGLAAALPVPAQPLCGGARGDPAGGPAGVARLLLERRDFLHESRGGGGILHRRSRPGEQLVEGPGEGACARGRGGGEQARTRHGGEGGRSLAGRRWKRRPAAAAAAGPTAGQMNSKRSRRGQVKQLKEPLQAMPTACSTPPPQQSTHSPRLSSACQPPRAGPQ